MADRWLEAAQVVSILLKMYADVFRAFYPVVASFHPHDKLGLIETADPEVVRNG